MLVHQAYRFELSPNNVTRSRFASHCGASRFVYNWGLALVKARLAAREEIRLACYKELLSDEATEVLVGQIEVPWSMCSQRVAWNTLVYTSLTGGRGRKTDIEGKTGWILSHRQ